MVGAAPKQAVPLVLIGLAALEGGDQGLERAVVDGDDIIGTEEEIDFAGAGELVAGIPKREVQDEEEVVVVLVELGTFNGAENVFEVERVEVGEAVVQRFDIGGGRVDDVDPGCGIVSDDAGGHGADSTPRSPPIAMGEDWSPTRALAQIGTIWANGFGVCAKAESEWRLGIGAGKNFLRQCGWVVIRMFPGNGKLFCTGNDSQGGLGYAVVNMRVRIV